jgi:hypothetical protein
MSVFPTSQAVNQFASAQEKCLERESSEHMQSKGDLYQ